MICSYNRIMKDKNSERNIACPNQYMGCYNNNNNTGQKYTRGQEKSTRSAIFFNKNTISRTNSSNLLKFSRSNNNGSHYGVLHHRQQLNRNIRRSQNNYHYQQQPLNRLSPGNVSQVCTNMGLILPINIKLLAGSKCYDAPAPTALPMPPKHWIPLKKKLTRTN